MATEYLQGQRLHSSFGKSVPVLGHWENIFWCSERTSCISVHGPCPVTGPYWKELSSAFFAARTHCLLRFNLVSIRTPGPFLPTFFPDVWPSANSHAQDCYFPGARLCTSTCSASSVSPFLHPVKVSLDNCFPTEQKKQVRIGSFSKTIFIIFF